MLPGKPGLICFDLITTQRMEAAKCISLIQTNLVEIRLKAIYGPVQCDELPDVALLFLSSAAHHLHT
jgi:hypothetical protein